MPSLTTQIGPAGPTVSLGIAVSAPRQRALQIAGLPIPQPLVITGLVDTGASCTCVDASVIQRLGLEPTGTTLIHTPSTGATPHSCNQFDVALSIFMDNQQVHLMSLVIPVIEADFSAQQIQALIGRDVLSKGIFIYNGVNQQMTVTF